jgi:Ser/Thr protein kinase RdoA (MazF antagonist)
VVERGERDRARPGAAACAGPDLRAVGRRFAIEGTFVAGEAHGNGHIHDTFVATWDHAGRRSRFVHQRLNTRVFRDPAGVMRNLERVTDHVRASLAREGACDIERRCLALVRAREGTSSCSDDEGRVWRTFRFVEGARTHDAPGGPDLAFEAARAFADFTARLADLDPRELAVTIPRFHDLASRFADLAAARRSDALGRAAPARRELERAEHWFERLAAGLEREGAAALPRRTVHNDCKINNVLIDEATGEALCVIDLDTVMEGTLLFDFGDLVRTAACPSAEDEMDLAAVRFDLGLFEALARGYLAGGSDFLGEAEIGALPVAGSTLALENAIRFLTDHLEGDVYFRIHRAGHNLDRARAQLRVVELMDEASDAARSIVTRAAREARRAAR